MNLRPSAPKADALPNCATPRCVPIRSTQAKTCLSYYRLEHIVFMRPSNRICTARRSTRHVVDGEFTPLRVVLPYGHHSTYYHENWLDRIRTCNLSVNSGSHYRCATDQTADKEGFEPSEDISAFSDLANRRIRPLCHLSNDPDGIRTRVLAVKGRYPSQLDDRTESVAEDLHLYCSVSDCLFCKATLAA